MNRYLVLNVWVDDGEYFLECRSQGLIRNRPNVWLSPCPEDDSVHECVRPLVVCRNRKVAVFVVAAGLGLSAGLLGVKSIHRSRSSACFELIIFARFLLGFLEHWLSITNGCDTDRRLVDVNK